MEQNLSFEKSFNFAIRIIRLYQFLCEKKKEYILSKQVLRSGTSIGANLSEALYGISKKDFLSKIHISLKEAAETQYWLKLLFATDYIKKNEYESLEHDCTELIKIFTSIAKTTKKEYLIIIC